MTNIYVGNLSFRATEQDVRQAFQAFGDVTSVHVVVDKETGRSRGFAFVEMSNSDQATSAIEGLNGQEIAGRRVTVNEARPQTERPPRSGGGGRYGDRGGNDRGGNERGGNERGGNERGGNSGGAGGGERSGFRSGGDRYASGQRGGGERDRGGERPGNRPPRRSGQSRDQYDE